MQNYKTIYKKRTGALFLLLAAFASIIIVRLFYLQVIKAETLRSEALADRQSEIILPPQRGNIYDRNGNLLAQSISVESLVANPKQLMKYYYDETKEAPPEDKEKDGKNLKPKPLGLLVDKLSQILNLDEKAKEKLRQKLSNTRSSYVWIKRKLSYDEAKALKKLLADKEDEVYTFGLELVEETQRYYPHNDFAAHLLGYAGTDNQGLAGLELSLDKYLKGIPGRLVTERDARGLEIPESSSLYIPARPGNNVYLTIDETIQYFVERELNNIESQLKPALAMIIVMDPKTGEILGMGSRPNFNPNEFAKYPAEVREKNFAIWYNYEPGSTFKIITSAAALEEGVVHPQDRFYDPGYIVVNGRKIKCWSKTPHGAQSFAEVIQNSCNPGFVKVGLSLGKERFYKYIRSFGFGEKTGIELPGEQKGLIIPEDKVTNVNLATISIGQSIAVTPIQLIRAVCAVANGGKLVEPHVVKKIVDQAGNIVLENKPRYLKRVISEETARTLRELLERVVLKGTGTKAYIKGFRVAGKTGTAQVVSPTGGYAPGKYVASFVGFAPANDPKFAALVVIVEPSTGVYYGGQIAAPVFKSLGEDILRYMGVKPQEDPEPAKNEGPIEVFPEEVRVPALEGLTLWEAQKKIIENGLIFNVEGHGPKVVKQSPEPGVIVPEGTEITLTLGQGKGDTDKVIVPELTGLTFDEVSGILKRLGLGFRYIGSGVAVEQNISPGTVVPPGTVVEVKFKN
ncbi:stage V sporulation protein D [Carboxydothermus ferrireducens]|uniref:Stage V sporulation protein D (Sporulation-specific penicillin-binding protein) n=1 Tax=Carboxydothermus ferrireducens DSM 11255 TaxID=1119529 RepID=A0ABX2RCW9_9THEO|nr:stage V sporulation protein D [Carboxydothermus ferrireducens]NYE58790.1 stage V sporulation protein D (sporulation-specific penicillin-binding protein) [Carboxydothermus ferrireducens DSM 11255]